jgi:hypothetical protein
MIRKITFSISSFLFLIVCSESCSRNYCTHETLYSIYQTRFKEQKSDGDFVKTDLEIKQKIFSALCISHDIKKMIIVEFANATQAFYSRGLLFTYDDSKTYYYNIKNGHVIAGKGNNGYNELARILSAVKNDYSNAEAKIKLNHVNYFDVPIVNVLLYDSSQYKKFSSFSFPIIIDSLPSR